MLGIFLVRVDLILESADRSIQVSELLVHDCEILFHLPDVVLEDTDGVQLNEQARQIPHNALEHELRQRSDALVGDDEKEHQYRPDQNGEVQSICRSRD